MPPPEPLKVLIADDSKPVADMLTELVSQPGRVEVVGVVGSEAEATMAVERLRPDVVILDLQLKTGSGADVIRAVRANKELAGTYILVTSNHASPHLKAGCLELGANEYYDKVKELPELAKKLEDLASAKR